MTTLQKILALSYKAVTKAASGSYAVSTRYVAALICDSFAGTVTKVAVVDGGIVFLGRDGTAVLGPIPEWVVLPANTYAPRLYVVDHAAKTLSDYNVAQWLAVFISSDEEGEDNRLVRLWKVLRSPVGGTESATSLLLRYLQDGVSRAAMPFGATEAKFAQAGIDIARIRALIPPNPAAKGHPVDVEKETTLEWAPRICARAGAAISATSPNNPGEVFAKAGSTGHARIVEQVTPACEWLESSRHAVAASNIRQAVRLALGAEDATVVSSLAAGAQPDSFTAITAIMSAPEVKGDMIALTAAKRNAVTLSWEQTFAVPVGSTLLVRDLQVIGNVAEIAVCANGTRISRRTLRAHPAAQSTVAVIGDIVGGVAESDVVVRVTTTRPLVVGDKLSDRHSNKGLCRPLRRSLAATFGGSTLSVEAILSPERMGATEDGVDDGTCKSKTASAKIEAVWSQIARLRGERMAIEPDVTLDDTLTALENALRGAVDMIEDEGERNDVLFRLDEVDALRALGPSDELECARWRLAFWPVYDEGQYVGEALISFHAFIVAPQVPEVQTPYPVGDKHRQAVVEGEDGVERVSLPSLNSKVGMAALENYEGAVLRQRAPALARYLLDNHRDPGAEMLEQRLVDAVLQR